MLPSLKFLHSHDASRKTNIEERFTRKDAEGMISFSMEGLVKNQNETLPRIGSYGGEFVFENRK
jgi:hypothetical protein